MTISATSEVPAGRSGGGQPTVPAVRLLLFASAREAAGTASAEVSAESVDGVLAHARARFGERFGAVLDRSRVWVNGEPVPLSHLLSEGDEVAVLPPVSGG
jgi:molybdopterin synthase sulfur carrier subunit